MGRAPDPVEPEALIAFIDGEADAAVALRIARDPHLSARARAYADAQRDLRGRLHRFDCPSPQELGEYDLGLLAAAPRTMVARHILACPRCAEELRVLRDYLAVEADMPRLGVVERGRRLVATLIAAPLRPSTAAQRGTAASVTLTYQASAIRVALTHVADRPGATIKGLIWCEEDGEVPPGGSVSLHGPDGTIRTAAIDELGDFAFDDVGSGIAQLEVALGDDHIIIEAVNAHHR